MMLSNFLPLGLGLIIFSFLINSVLIVPFIDLLYKLKLTRRKEAPGTGKIPLFDKLHDKKAGTPVGGGILIITTVVILFVLLMPLAAKMGVVIQSSFKPSTEIFLILFSYISFGILGLSDDLIKIFGKPQKGVIGFAFGLRRGTKFVLQWVLALFIGYVIYRYLGITILHIPLVGQTIDLGIWYVPFSAFVIVSFVNAVNITDGLDGLVSGLLTGSIVGLVVIGGIFVVEAASSAIQIVGWRVFKKPIFPLAPIHHSFLAVGWEEPKIVMRAWLAGIILAIFGLWLATI